MDSYINSLTPAANGISTSANRNTHQSPSQGPSPEEEMQRQLDEFNRSVTIVVWYKANTEPIRLQMMLPTFPYFQLSRFSNLIADLGLSNSSYLDTYIPASSQWEQHTIASVRIVETQQRLLYKIRRSLMDGLSEDECPSFRDELQGQSRNGNSKTEPSPPTNNTPASSSIPMPPKPPPTSSAVKKNKSNQDGQNSTKASLKRSAPADSNIQESGNSSKIHITPGYYLNHTGTATLVSSSMSGPRSSDGSISNVADTRSNGQTQDNNVYMYENPVYYNTNSSIQPSSSDDTITNDTLPHYLIAPPAPAPPIPYHPHPPLKRWPNDYTVSELSAGFHAMDLLIAQSPTGASMTQRTAFERVFGSRYVKSTVCRHRAVWRKAHRALREQFEAMGTDDRACWGEFVRRVEGRPPGKGSGSDIMSPSPSATMGYHEQQSGGEDEDVRGPESVMGSLQNQVPSAPSNNAMQNNMNVYDPSRSHMANGGHGG